MPTSRPVGLDFLRKNHWLSARQLSPASFSVSLGQHLAFTLACAAVLMALYSLLRLALLLYNGEQIGTASATTLAEAFLNGLRFDLRLVVYAPG